MSNGGLVFLIALALVAVLLLDVGVESANKRMRREHVRTRKRLREEVKQTRD